MLPFSGIRRLLGALAGGAALLQAEPASVTCAKIFGSHMVLPRERAITVWGEGPPGRPVEVALGQETVRTQVSQDGQWAVALHPRSASTVPERLRVNEIVFEDVLVGDVWLCSGQSNMAFALKQAAGSREDLAALSNPLVRIAHHEAPRLRAPEGYTAAELARCHEQTFFTSRWLKDQDPGIAAASAVAWHFGHALQPRVGVPLGLIVVAVGGSAMNNWIPESALREVPGGVSLFTEDWLENPAVKPLLRTRARDALRTVLEPGRPYLAGQMPYRWMGEPSFLFEAGITPLRHLGLKGVLWYQGESDASDDLLIAHARPQLPTLIRSWRDHFQAPTLPWLMVELPSFHLDTWADFRELQRQTARTIPGVGLAVTIDLGEKTDVHPTDKRPVGERLAWLALRQVYGRPAPAIPRIESASRDGGRLRLRLDPESAPLRPVPGAVSGFETAGPDGRFASAEARVIAPEVIELKMGMQAVRQVRYLWSGFPEPRPQLFSTDGLPLGSFVRELTVEETAGR